MDLLNAVPFALGAEYITKDWIQLVFSNLQKILAKEIAKTKTRTGGFL